jgi:Amt family ammonium transporter
MINSILAPSIGGIFTFFTKRFITREKATTRMDFQALTNGILAGLVCVTASCNCIEPWASLLIGIIGSVTYSLACVFAEYFKVDDPLEAFQVHGFCGFMGVLMLSVFKIDKGLIYTLKSEVDGDIAGPKLFLT